MLLISFKSTSIHVEIHLQFVSPNSFADLKGNVRDKLINSFSK